MNWLLIDEIAVSRDGLVVCSVGTRLDGAGGSLDRLGEFVCETGDSRCVWASLKLGPLDLGRSSVICFPPFISVTAQSISRMCSHSMQDTHSALFHGPAPH